MALTTTPGNTAIPSTDLTATATSTDRPPAILPGETILIIAAAVPSGIAFILAIALITVIACWCRSRRRIKKLKKRPKKTSVAVSLETLEDARARSLREAQANRLQLLQNGANELGLGQTNPQDVQHDEYYGNSSDLPQSPVEARQSEIDDGDYVNVEPTIVIPARVRVPVQDDQDDEEDELDYENVSGPIQFPVMRPKRKNSDDDEKDEHDYVNVPKGGKPGTSPERAPVLARVSHLLQD